MGRVLLLAMLLMLAMAFTAVAGVPPIRTVLEAGKYKHLSNSSYPPSPAVFRVVTVEQATNFDTIYGAFSIGEWRRATSIDSEAAFILSDLVYHPTVEAGWGIRLAGGLALLDQTTPRSATRYQFHLAVHVTLDFGLVDIRYGCHHFSNGNSIHGYRRSQPNHAEEFCGAGIGGRF